MAKITRKKQKVLGESAPNNGQFGSRQLGPAGVNSLDPDVIQALPAFSTGWLQATLTAKRIPPLEEIQGIDYLVTRQLAYIFQEGIPEYESGTTYYTNSIVKKSGTYQLYGSIVDNNTGNALTDATKWVPLADLSTGSGLLPGTPFMYSGNTPPAGSLAADGSAISRSSYSALFAAIGTTFGAGNGTTTFNIPDDRGLIYRGWDNGAGIDTGRSFGSVQKGTIINFDVASGIATLSSRSPSSSSGSGQDDLGLDYMASPSDHPNSYFASVVSSTVVLSANTGEAGFGIARMRNRAYLACIKY